MCFRVTHRWGGGGGITQGPSIHHLYSVFFLFYDLCKNVIQALSGRQEDLSVVISLEVITILADRPSGLAKMIGNGTQGKGGRELDEVK